MIFSSFLKYEISSPLIIVSNSKSFNSTSLFAIIFSWSLKYEILSALISIFFFKSLSSTFFSAIIISLFLEYKILFALIIIFFLLSLNSTLPSEINVVNILLYSKFSALIEIPSLVNALPPLIPLKMFPFWLISISVTSKLKISLECALELRNRFRKKITEKYKNLFFINIIYHKKCRKS